MIRRVRESLLLSGLSWLVCFVFLLSVFVNCTPQASGKSYLVVRAIDGDTVELSGGAKLRYIGIDTPEKGEPFYKEAKTYNRQLVEGKRVKIEYDVQEKDRYGRLLGYVYVDDYFVNAEMIKEGLAFLYTYPPNVRYSDYFVKLQKSAREEGKGVWTTAVVPEEYYLAVRGSKRFHRPECRSIRDTKPEDLLEFRGRDEALDKGFSACRNCKP